MRSIPNTFGWVTRLNGARIEASRSIWRGSGARGSCELCRCGRSVMTPWLTVVAPSPGGASTLPDRGHWRRRRQVRRASHAGGAGRAVGLNSPGGAAGLGIGDREAGEQEAQRRRATPLVDRPGAHRPVLGLVVVGRHLGDLRAALDHRAVLVVEVEKLVVAGAVAAGSPDALAAAECLEPVGDAAERGEVAPLIGVVGELGAWSEGEGDAMVVLAAVPPRGEEPHPVAESQAESVGEEALLRPVPGDLAGDVLELHRPIAGRRSVTGLHAAEELVDVATG